MQKIDLRKSEIIFQKGDLANGLYLITQGSVGIFMPTNDGKDPDFILPANEIFGEMGVIDKSLRSGRADALTDANLIQISQHEFADKLSKSDPFITGLNRILVTRIRGLLKTIAQSPASKGDAEETNQNSES